MREIDFTKIIGIEGVAKYFYSSSEFISELISAPDQKLFYKELRIRKTNIKRRAEFRVVYKGCPQVAQIQKNIATAIDQSVTFPICVQGFVKKRSTGSNAQQHLARKILLKADIKDFFDSITVDRVLAVFTALGCERDVADILSRVCTLNGTLHQGLHSSPILSNLVVKDLDSDLKELADHHGATYSRYSDDITVSTDSKLPTKEEVYSIFLKHGFLPNENKFHVRKRGQPQYVTGLSVFDSIRPRVPKSMKKRLRLNLYFIKKFGLGDHFKRLGIPDFAQNFYYNHLRGTLDYINAIEPELAMKMYPLLPHLKERTSSSEEFVAGDAVRSFYEEE